MIDLHRQLGNLMILVTHDQSEAMAVGDRVAVLDTGRIVQVGTPSDVYGRPASLSSDRRTTNLGLARHFDVYFVEDSGFVYTFEPQAIAGSAVPAPLPAEASPQQ